MHRFFSRHIYLRSLHTKSRLPELDLTKPTSDRVKKRASKDQQSYSNNDHDQQSLLKVSLRGQCLFGLYPIELALKSKRRQFHQLFLSQTSDDNRPMMENIRQLATQLSVPVQYTDTNVLDRLAFDRPHQGVCLDCSPLPLENIDQCDMQDNSSKISFDLCLVKIHDPMNLGAMLRTAHFFGIDRILLTRGTCQPSPVVSKASSGALELMFIYTCHDLKSYVKRLQEETNVVIVCATHQGTIPLRTLRLNDMKQGFRRIILLIGNEHEGIPDEIIQMCDYNVSITPNITSEISSLNASVACALFLYHISAQMKT